MGYGIPFLPQSCFLALIQILSFCDAHMNAWRSNLTPPYAVSQDHKVQIKFTTSFHHLHMKLSIWALASASPPSWNLECSSIGFSFRGLFIDIDEYQQNNVKYVRPEDYKQDLIITIIYTHCWWVHDERKIFF